MMNKTKLTAAHAHQKYNPYSGKKFSLWIKNHCHAWVVRFERGKQAMGFTSESSRV